MHFHYAAARQWPPLQAHHRYQDRYAVLAHVFHAGCYLLQAVHGLVSNLEGDPGRQAVRPLSIVTRW
jgi:hypothetical protein